jgi:hypothetical protein
MVFLPTLVNEQVLVEMCKLMQTTPLEGCIVEVGVYLGGSLQRLHLNSQGRPVFGYDTFTGIPFKDEIDSHRVGDFGDTSYERVRSETPLEVTLVQGVFPDSAVDMPPVSFVHVDCDQYRSVRDTIKYLSPLMLPGGIMWFDDYGCLASADLAVNEAFGDRVERVIAGKAVVRFN